MKLLTSQERIPRSKEQESSIEDLLSNMSISLAEYRMSIEEELQQLDEVSIVAVLDNFTRREIDLEIIINSLRLPLRKTRLFSVYYKLPKGLIETYLFLPLEKFYCEMLTNCNYQRVNREAELQFIEENMKKYSTRKLRSVWRKQG